jgi:tetratricopeptide (TPR) repeat protein
LPVDWNVVDAALQHSREGSNLKALAELSRLLELADCNADRAAIRLAEASCYSQLGDVNKFLELVTLAKQLAHDDRAVLSQVELSEANLYAQSDDYDRACELFASLRSNYHDLLIVNKDFAVEVDSRFACALVEAKRYKEAVPVFRTLLASDELEDRQRLQVFFGFALFRTGHKAEAQSILFAATKGKDVASAQIASNYLAELETAQ